MSERFVPASLKAHLRKCLKGKASALFNEIGAALCPTVTRNATFLFETSEVRLYTVSFIQPFRLKKILLLLMSLISLLLGMVWIIIKSFVTFGTYVL